MIHSTLIQALLRQRAASPVRMALLLFMFFAPILITASAPGLGLGPLGNGYGIVIVIAAGMIGQDVSSGVLQLLLARPIRRDTYVLSRWLGAALGGFGLIAVQAGLCTLVLWMRGAPPDTRDLALLLGDNLLLALGLCAVLALCSSLLGGLGDLAILFLATLAAKLMEGASQLAHSPILGRVGTELENVCIPQIHLFEFMSPSGPPWFAIVSYVSTVVLCLALAIVVVNRKELSYAAAG
ncbi:MAG TPA: ABC transporter permease subunit [Candidatus Saccharimonadaceae bacterium]|nr:ABC transporter permease subunit [Candidatus Saccharimonadaceae bacterium]